MDAPTLSAPYPTAPIQLVFVIDGLNPRFLGPYGNHWVPTPFFDRLAAHGVVFDQYYAESNNPAANLLAMLNRTHALGPGVAPNSSESRCLISDDVQLPQEVQSFFETVEFIEDEQDNNSPLETMAAAALEKIDRVREQARETQIWIHTRGLFKSWMAPLEIQEWFKDESDPDPIEFPSPPQLMLEQDFDPDQRLAFLHAYAAEVVEYDRILGDFFAAIKKLVGQVYWAVTSLRGYPLGEHLEVGDGQSTLNVEKVHCPLLVCSASGKPSREQNLYSSSTFSACFKRGGPNQESVPITTDAVISADSELARIQTSEWAYIRTDSDWTPDQRGSLYSKPDDVLELNEVSAVCPEISQFLHEQLNKCLLDLENQSKPIGTFSIPEFVESEDIESEDIQKSESEDIQ